MSDTGTFGFVGNGVQFPGKNNVVRDGSGSNAFGWHHRTLGPWSFAAGFRNVVSGASAFAAGGFNISSGANSTSTGVNNTASGAESFCCGNGSTASGSWSFASTRLNTSSGNASATFGQNNTATSFYTFAQGIASTASDINAVCFGAYGLASRYGEFAHAGIGISSAGVSQHGWLIYGNQSTSATPILLYLDGSAATKNAVLAAGARWKCTLEIMAATTGAIDKSASWEYKFQIDRPTTASTTIIRTTPLLTLSDGSNAGAPPAGWSIAITADTTNGCPQIQFTGDSDTINVTGALHYVQAIRV